MSPRTAAERKAAERERKRAQGLILKQVWVTPEAWPIISDLATQEVEEQDHAAFINGGGTDGKATFSDGVPVSFVYEFASELTEDALAHGEAAFTRDEAPAFLRHVIRVMLKIYDPLRRAHPESVRAISDEWMESGND